MSIISRIDALGNIGVKESYDSWEIYLTRKLNFLSFIGLFNISVTLIIFSVLGIKDFTIELLLTILFGSCVPLLNKVKNYVWAGYLFYMIGVVLFFFISLKMGLETLALLYYFPILISLVQVFGRKETLKQLFIIAGLFFISIALMIVCYYNHFLYIAFPEDTMQFIKLFNIISSFFLTTTLVLLLATESIKQEAVIKNMLNEKEILLAEVFHRVKNNMNIVTSLLNLKKHASKSEEVKNALEECKSRVYSMALVHQKIYNNKTIHSLDFKDYVNDLVNESINSTGGAEKIEVTYNTEPVDLPINYAIPCGLILNELITNSFKHAQTKDKKLKIDIGLSKCDGWVVLSVKDNGPGIDVEKKVDQTSLGMDLIHSLAEQIDGKFSMSNENGTLSKVEFRKD